MHFFTPFNRDISKITTADLNALREVKEGWYVEYKAEITSQASIAKSIAALANSYGGWLFYGVSEKAKDNPVAGNFPGIATDALSAALQSIRQAAAEYLSPLPHFDIYPFNGPDVETGLAADRTVIVVRVPWGPNAPFVHKDGRIYRRVADASEPKPESDRFVLDQLWRRSEPKRKAFADWFDEDPVLTDAEGDMSYLRLLVTADVWGDKGLNGNLPLARMRDIFRGSKKYLDVPFDSVFTTESGFLCRQTMANAPGSLALHARLRSDLRFEVFIPLARFTGSVGELFNWLAGYKGRADFTRLLKDQRYESANVLDCNFLFFILNGAMRKYVDVLTEAEYSGELYGAMKVGNLLRVVPFIDVEATLKDFGEHGLPTCLDRNICLYKGTLPDALIDLPQKGAATENDDYAVILAVRLFVEFAKAIGLPLEPTLATGEHEHTGMDDFITAGNRAIEAQRLRVESARRT